LEKALLSLSIFRIE